MCQRRGSLIFGGRLRRQPGRSRSRRHLQPPRLEEIEDDEEACEMRRGLAAWGALALFHDRVEKRTRDLRTVHWLNREAWETAPFVRQCGEPIDDGGLDEVLGREMPPAAER